MAIFVSDVLAKCAAEKQVDLTQLVRMFAWWKAEPGRISESLWFGKDGLYDQPQLQGRGRILRHCHLIPLLDKEENERWVKIFKRRGVKTSDKALVYVESEAGRDFLLLYILGEPGAHTSARSDRNFMNALYRRAIAFLDGEHSQCNVA